MPKQKPTVTTERSHYLKGHASWLYCDGYNQTVAYLCYVTYQYFRFEFSCTCGSHGVAENSFAGPSPEDLLVATPTRNATKRFCCQKDGSPLFSPVPKNLKAYQADVVCKACATRYQISETFI